MYKELSFQNTLIKVIARLEWLIIYLYTKIERENVVAYI